MQVGQCPQSYSRLLLCTFFTLRVTACLLSIALHWKFLLPAHYLGKLRSPTPLSEKNPQCVGAAHSNPALSWIVNVNHSLPLGLHCSALLFATLCFFHVYLILSTHDTGSDLISSIFSCILATGHQEHRPKDKPCFLEVLPRDQSSPVQIDW